VQAANRQLRNAAWLCGLGDSELASTNGATGLRDSDNARLRKLLVCPECHHDLQWHDAEVECAGCGVVYELVDGIPVLRREANAHKDLQAEYFDEADPEFEVTRPHGSPWLYRWLLAEKFRRSVDALPPSAGGMVAATVCGGSGMDAEFLARVGMSVISTDISLGAATGSTCCR
jgi:uncharacterized protein YbaR (Trm112 family)